MIAKDEKANQKDNEKEGSKQLMRPETEKQNRSDTELNKTSGCDRSSRIKWIRENAYFKAEARGFEPGKALDDWLEAEAEFIELKITLYLTRLQEDGEDLSVRSLQQLAIAIGIENPEKLGRDLNLVRAIQKASSQRPCFRANTSKHCKDQLCLWRNECRKLVAEWIR